MDGVPKHVRKDYGPKMNPIDPSDIIQTLKWTFIHYDMILFDRFLFGNDLFGNMIASKNWRNRSDSNLESLTLRLSIQSHGSTH